MRYILRIKGLNAGKAPVLHACEDPHRRRRGPYLDDDLTHTREKPQGMQCGWSGGLVGQGYAGSLLFGPLVDDVGDGEVFERQSLRLEESDLFR